MKRNGALLLLLPVLFNLMAGCKTTEAAVLQTIAASVTKATETVCATSKITETPRPTATGTPVKTAIPTATSTIQPTATRTPTPITTQSSTAEMITPAYTIVLVKIGTLCWEPAYYLMGAVRTDTHTFFSDGCFSYNGRTLFELAIEFLYSPSYEATEEKYSHLQSDVLPPPETPIRLYTREGKQKTVQASAYKPNVQMIQGVVSVTAGLTEEWSEDCVIGLSGDYNPLPRPVSYTANQAKADLDGDGTKETLTVEKNGEQSRVVLHVNGQDKVLEESDF